MRRAFVAIIVFLGCASFAADFTERRTSLPFTYVLDYDGDHLDNPKYIEQVRMGPPYLLHLGTDTPCHSYFGAAFDWKRLRAALAGKEVPRPDYTAEFRQRMASLTKLADDLHKAGAKRVTPYVCLMTTGGEPEKRWGFWEMYDNWEAYNEWGIGPRPKDDPIEWIQRKPDGSPQYFYAHDHPPYKPMFRFANCVNNPNWKRYMMWVIRTTAQCGFDGVFVDNATSHRCYCKCCQEGFAKFLARKYSAEEIKGLFGDSPALGTNKDGLRWAETQLFWAESIHDFLGEMKEAGAKVHGSFYIFPNALCGGARWTTTAVRDVDLGMDENSGGKCGSHPGMTSERVIAGISVQQVNDNIFTHRHTQAANALVRSALLTRAGYPKEMPEWKMNKNVGALGLAEAAAFSGGGTFLHRPVKNDPELAEVRVSYNKFFAEHRDFYEGLLPYGEVAVACFAEQTFYGNSAQPRIAERLMRGLMSDHVLVDLVTERNFEPQVLKRYRALILPAIKYMSDRNVAAALEFAKVGGRLLAGGATGACDDKMRERKDPPFAAYATSMETKEVRKRVSTLTEVVEKRADTELVRLAAYADDPAAPGKIILHWVNYAVPLGVDAAPVEEIKDVKVSLPLPKGCKAASVILAVPGEADRALEVKTENDRAVFTVPTLRIYGACRINMEK